MSPFHTWRERVAVVGAALVLVIATPARAQEAPSLAPASPSGRITICEGRGAWWFCEDGQAITENEFVRRYQRVTGQGDLNRFLVDRGPYAELLTLAGAAVLGVGVLTLAVRPYEASAETRAELDVARVYDVGFGVGYVATGLLIGGFGVSRFGFQEGDPTEHELSVLAAQRALERYEAARGGGTVPAGAPPAEPPLRVTPLVSPNGVGLAVVF